MTNSKRRVVLITQHYWGSKRKAGFHWLAHAYHEMGWEVIFFTCYVSWISWLRGERRFPRNLLCQVTRERGKLQQIQGDLYSYVWFTPWHPANLRSDFLNNLSTPLFANYGHLSLDPVESLLESADLFIFEPTPGLLLFDRLKKLAPSAKFVYRVSDDLHLLKRHPIVLETETRISLLFDLISVPSQYIYERFLHCSQTRLQYHGLNTKLFDEHNPNPYLENSFNLVFVGNSRFDYEFLCHAIRLFPSWNFHIIGPIRDLPIAPNVTAYGERPFSETVPYIQHANIGLHTLAYSPGAESFTDSLKVQQYTYCQLPIVAPSYLRTSRLHTCYYDSGDVESIHSALVQASLFDRSTIDTASVTTWRNLARDILSL